MRADGNGLQCIPNWTSSLSNTAPFDKLLFKFQESLAAAGDDQADAGGDGETGEKGLKSMSFAKLHQLCIRFGSFIKGKVTGSDPKAKIQDRNLKKHQKRLSSGAAVRYPGLSHALTGQLLGMTVNGKHFDPFFLDIGPLLGIKCDVCVLSEERQVFRLLDAILESNLWPLEATTTTKSRQQEEMDNNHSSRKNQKKEQLKTNQHLTHAQIVINGNPPLD